MSFPEPEQLCLFGWFDPMDRGAHHPVRVVGQECRCDCFVKRAPGEPRTHVTRVAFLLRDGVEAGPRHLALTQREFREPRFRHEHSPAVPSAAFNHVGVLATTCRPWTLKAVESRPRALPFERIDFLRYGEETTDRGCPLGFWEFEVVYLTDRESDLDEPNRGIRRAFDQDGLLVVRIGREERDAYQQVDRDATDRGINRSGIRTSRLVEIAEEHDRVRERAVRDWKRQLEDAGIKDLPEPPPSSAAQPSRFREDETTFDRHWIGRDPLFYGWCGRLAYVASVGGGEAWWCPEHDYEVS